MDEDELLDPGPHRSIPRWLVVAVVLIVVGGASYLLVQRNRSNPHRPVAASTPVRRTAPVAPVSLTPPPGVGAALHLSGATAIAVAVTPDASWVLTTRQVDRLSASGSIATAAVPSPPLPIDGVSVTHLEVDAAAHTVWVVHEATKHARIYAYDMSTMRLRRTVGTLGFVNAAAAMGGHLYVCVGDNLIDIGPSGPPLTLERTRDSIGALAADPLRRRLIVSDYGDPTRVWSFYPSSHRLVGPVLIRATKASIGVTRAGTIWLAGFDTGAGSLMRLDPVTLRPVLRSPFDGSLEPGAVLAASGDSVVWIRLSGGDQLDCVDARTGENLQTWVVAGDVASTRHHALIAAVDTSAAPLELGRCPG